MILYQICIAVQTTFLTTSGEIAKSKLDANVGLFWPVKEYLKLFLKF